LKIRIITTLSKIANQKKEKMNCEQAKKIQIADFLSNQGHKPIRVYGNNDAWYNSPVRTDKNPSFKVNLSKNQWYDAGTGSGGNILDLVILMYNTDITGALLILQKPGLSKPSFSFSEKQKTAGIEIKHVQPIQNRALLQYLNERSIPFEIACIYVMEAYYVAGRSRYFALAFKNDKGGYELRNGFKTDKFPEGFKGAASPKYITTIPGNNSTINVFEGFMDFLSAMVYYKTRKPGNKTIILNTVENLKYIEPLLISARNINLFLDNDDAGNRTVQKIKALNPNVTNYSSIIYPKNKDFNDFLNVQNYGNTTTRNSRIEQ